MKLKFILPVVIIQHGVNSRFFGSSVLDLASGLANVMYFFHESYHAQFRDRECYYKLENWEFILVN